MMVFAGFAVDLCLVQRKYSHIKSFSSHCRLQSDFDVDCCVVHIVYQLSSIQLNSFFVHFSKMFIIYIPALLSSK